ncbi:MAG: anhydro-N-acetylmuramic acid kinase [Bacteroidota bacterium]
MPHPIHQLVQPGSRVVLGLMSGTSLDGVDAVVVRLEGSRQNVEVETLGFASTPYDDALRTALRACVEAATSDVRLVSQLHVRLAHHFADVSETALHAAGLAASDLDLVGSHGQTVQHVPDAEDCAGVPTRSTLQLGCPATLAARLRTPVISDFRAGDMALGGQGAPLAPTIDTALFGHPTETRVLLNLGGIANLTVLPPGQPPSLAFDTGPANMVIDAIASRLLGAPYDADGAHAALGTPDEALLGRQLEDAYFRRPPPKSTGREFFDAAYVDRFLADGPANPNDALATAVELTARSVAHAVRTFVPGTPARVIASGGGIRNPTLMHQLEAALGAIELVTTETYGLNPDAKEAVLFALLAHEWANGVRTGLPAVTGASDAAFQGSLTLP